MRISDWSSDVCSSDLADAAHRATEADIADLKTRSTSGAMVPIGSVATFDSKTGPYRVTRYNLHTAVAVDGDTATGYSSGASLTQLDKVAATVMHSGYGHDRTGLALTQKRADNTAGIECVLAVGVRFLGL